jgi:hypothetical protein
MADPFVALSLKAVPYAYDNYGQIYDPIKRKVNKMRRRGEAVDYDDVAIHGGWKHDDRGLVLKKRSEVASDEEIVETVPRRNTNNRQLVRRTSSVDRAGYDRRDGRHDRRVGAYRGGDASDSEGSVPPRSRVSAKSRSRAKSSSGRGGKRSSSSSSSDLGSTTDDEKRCKKIARKKWITGGLAAVATVHAAAKVYSSIEAHDKRVQQVALGEISPEEAAKKKKQARWQDAAAIAIAALGIKGAISEWSEVQEQQHEHKELLESREERHQRRMERQRRKAKEEAERRRQGHGSDDDKRR